MTLLDEEMRAVKMTREFLLELMRPSGPWKKIGEIRAQAGRLLRHYPWNGRVDELYEKETK